LADARTVVTHVALHHDLAIFVELGDTKRTRDHAVAACDASRLARRLHDAVAGPFNRVRRAHLGTRRLFTVHADDRDSLHALSPADILEMNHRLAAMGVAFRARLHTGLAADAAIRVDEEVQIVRFRHRGNPSYCCG